MKTCEEFLQKFPGHDQRPEILCQLADAHLKQEHVAECEKYATQVIDDYPAVSQAKKAFRLLTGAKMVKNDWPAVAKTLEEADFKLEDIAPLWSQLKYATPNFNKRVDVLYRLLTTLEQDLNIDFSSTATASPQARYMLADLYTFAGRHQPAIDLLLPLTTRPRLDDRPCRHPATGQHLLPPRPESRRCWRTQARRGVVRETREPRHRRNLTGGRTG